MRTAEGGWRKAETGCYRPTVRSLLAVLLVLALPATARAQAEPAPPGYVAPGHEPEPPPPSPYKWHVAVDARLGVPLAQPPGVPSVGWGAGVQATRALVDFGRGRFGVGADFGYQRFQAGYDVTVPPEHPFLSHMTFAALLVLDGIFGRLRPWATLGGGLSVARFVQGNPDDPQRPFDVQAVVPLVQLGVGLDVAVWRFIEVGAAGQLDLTFSDESTGAPPTTVFAGGVFAARLEVGFRF